MQRVERKTSFLVAAIAVAMVISADARSQGYAPEEAVKRMTVANGLKVTLFASEPEVLQPIFVKCDARGRLWTIQYLQYPNPAGLKRVRMDRWSRTVYDRVPEPPPRGPRGADKITILEDTDGDGRADIFKDFVDGLNLVTGVAFGHGGVYVLNVPYLLFYPDKNCDDIPDADPQVLLSGFGMEDAQAMSNHLTWGPDGWLYGVNGSTTTCNIRGIEFQQGLWRYHPITHEFELFCEGGSNCYGVTFDANGECFYSTNGGPFIHAVQGGYYYKSFGKHGPLHNLYAYHFFPELTRDQVPGGPPTGGTVYLADGFPSRFHGAFIAGNFLGHSVSSWRVIPSGSTVRAEYGEVVLDSRDDWCGPTDVCMGPDGSIYASDFYDQRTAHPDPDARWDRSNGRIYKIAADGNVEVKRPQDVRALTSDELVDLLSHSNHWYVDRARVELAHRRDPAVVGRLRELAVQTNHHQVALAALWALHVTSGLDDALAKRLLDHPYAYVRFWTVRLLGDGSHVSAEIAGQLAELAAAESSPVVRAQLAATAKRVPIQHALPIIDSLLLHYPNESDSRIPWLIWWAIEAKATSHGDELVETLSSPAMWENPAARGNIMRLIRRFAAEGTADSYGFCVELLQSAPRTHLDDALQSMRQGLAERAVGLQGIGQGVLFHEHAAAGNGEQAATRRYERVTGPLRDYIAALWSKEPCDLLFLELALRADLEGAAEALMTLLFEPTADTQTRVALLRLQREFGNANAGTRLVYWIFDEQPEEVKLAALDVLALSDNREVMEALVAAYGKFPARLKSKVRDVLLSRPPSAIAFLQIIDAGGIPANDVPIDELRRLALYSNDVIDAMVRKHWGNIGPGSPEEKLATMRRFNNDLRSEGGDPQQGRELFSKHCGVCHQLHGDGKKSGPDLTTANRQDRATLLSNIVDPSAVIRREFVSYVVVTSTGQVYIGLLAEQDAATITVLDANNQRIKLQRDEIESIEESDVSLMPERILDALTPPQLRDLFAYLQQEAP